MNDQNPITNTNQQVAPTPPVQPPQEASGMRLVLIKLKPILKALWIKFYSNKKIFIPVCIAFGLIFLVILIGIIFGKRGNQVAVKTPTPSPFVLSTPEASSSGNILDVSQTKLNDLKNQINALDINESRLKPPTLNFDIKF